MNDFDRLLSNARLAQEERKRAQTALDSAKRREHVAISLLDSATKRLKAGADGAQTEHVVMEGDLYETLACDQAFATWSYK